MHSMRRAFVYRVCQYHNPFFSDLYMPMKFGCSRQMPGFSIRCACVIVFGRFGSRTDEQNGAKTVSAYSEVSPQTLPPATRAVLHIRQGPTRPTSASGGRKNRSLRCYALQRRANTVLTPAEWILIITALGETCWCWLEKTWVVCRISIHVKSTFHSTLQRCLSLPLWLKVRTHRVCYWTVSRSFVVALMHVMMTIVSDSHDCLRQCRPIPCFLLEGLVNRIL